MFDTIICTDIACEIMAQYRSKFIKPDYEQWNSRFNCKNLPWCYYKEYKTYDTDEIYKAPIAPDTIVYCHDEHQGILYQTTFVEVYNLVINLEPWDEIDIEIFSEDMDWTIAVTHEDYMILCGIDLMSM